MIMTAVAKAVHRGSDGSVHYLMSTPDSSLLVITDPVLGVDKIRFDGPLRKKPPRQLNRDPHPGEVTDGVEYESISATGTTMVSTAPGRGPLITQYGFCASCAFPPAGQLSRGHDYSLWPVCPGTKGSRTPTVVQAPEETVFHEIGIDHQKAFPVPGTVAQPAPEPAQSSGTDTPGVPADPSRGKPRVRVLDAESAPEPAPERGMAPVPTLPAAANRREVESRWGPGPGADW